MTLAPETPIVPFEYRHHEFHAFEYRNRQCILIPMPHPDMKHAWILPFQYKDVQYSFGTTRYGEGYPYETCISFFHRGLRTENLYNVYLPEGYMVIPKKAIRDLMFLEMPNPNYTYLVATPIEYGLFLLSRN